MDSEGSNLQTVSIALNSSNQKRKQDVADSAGPSHDAVYLANAFEKLTSTLAKALITSQSQNIVPVLSLALSQPSTVSLNNNIGDLN